MFGIKIVFKILSKVGQYDTPYLSNNQNVKWLVTFCEQCIYRDQWLA